MVIKRNQQGFTVIELLVVLAVIVILPTIVVANFPQIRMQFALSRTTHQFAQNVRMAQDRALSSIPYQDSSGNPQQVSGYGVYVDFASLGRRRYIIYADRYPGNQQYDVADYTVQTIDIEPSEPLILIWSLQNVFGSCGGLCASINFAPPNPTTNIPQLVGGNNQVEVRFVMATNPSNYRAVSINTAGLIEVR